MPDLRLHRHRERGSTDRALLDALLDDVLAGTLSTVVDGRPWVVPLLFARDGDRILLHGSTGAGALRHVADGAPAALAVVAVDAVSFTLMQDQLTSVLQTLSEREAGVVRLRFGLTDGQPRTLDEIGQVYGVTRERIRQIESKTMSKLRHPSRSQVLRDYLD